MYGSVISNCIIVLFLNHAKILHCEHMLDSIKTSVYSLKDFVRRAVVKFSFLSSLELAFFQKGFEGT